ncbi:nitrous oxide-stimulated promoter family protein [Muribaculum intestinale]|uniref:nitrous oxide-stimulated promoter family protein n=1 Tax=Muribaculum intestinale TaxID=1796646 RepID=UPI0025A99928|nr:nitrous oxide-stimulated promoter family protein [Muribaculum intestinale]
MAKSSTLSAVTSEKKHVISQMISIYCHKHHGTAGRTLCPECADMLAYACSRLDKCPRTPTTHSSCRRCTIHCYSPAYRDKIKKIMRYVGPRMLFIHPISAIRHFISETRGE